ncbi:MAG: hypothetical protein WAP52_02260, partial [Candidatus Sungiibacteriota bacterium]
MASPREGPPQSNEPEPATPEKRLMRLKTENPDINLDSPFEYGSINDNDGMAMYLVWARNATEERVMNEAFALGAEAGAQSRADAAPAKTRSTPESRYTLQRLKDENPDIEPTLLDDAFMWGNIGRQENLDHYFTASPYG